MKFSKNSGKLITSTKDKIEKKKVSIILPSYNGYKYIEKAIESCLKQTYSNIELIVIDDGSTNNIFSNLNNYCDERVKYYRNYKNLGMAASINIGFNFAIGEYFTWIGDDDFFLPWAIETMVKEIESIAGVDFVYANYYEVDEKDNILQPIYVGSPKSTSIGNYIGLCFLFKRDIYEKIGGVNPDAFLVEDYEYWLRIKKRFKMKKCGNILHCVRIHNNNLTGRYPRETVVRQMEKYRDLYNPKAIRYYLKGKKLFYENNLTSSKKYLIKSLIFNPINYECWRLLAIIYLHPLTVQKIRKIKRRIVK